MVEIVHTSPPTPPVEPQPAPSPAPEAQPTPAATLPASPAPAQAALSPSGIPAPDFLLPKFKSVEEQARAYVELEKALGKRPDVPAGIQPPPADPAPKGAEAIQSKLTAEFVQTGQVSPESRKAFTQSTGLPDSFIDSHIEYLQMREERAAGELHSVVGGKPVYEEMTAWAGKNLTVDEIQAFNSAVYSGDRSLAALAVQGLMAKYQGAMGQHPRRIVGRRATPAGVVPFQSVDEWKLAMRDPRYVQDEGFRREVAERLRAAGELGLL